ncbi:DNA topoisomerase type IIA subunit A/C-terminal [Arabidopsis thaliana x Arabidopsis arenosa]|uniref:DNA topoisomerase 2 n=1 Tax=Arabidopsis thaliana x Arabidopsis arenosa TaxID=1240361 RepID=A0A8T1XE14_9BRAS|nr:DNA topoisomerase type IIA subunit A/C-terminal [Arabidopsis thaliana x Arabidopsis arenosa]
MTELDNDVVALMSKRVLEIAGCLGKTVDLNGKQVPIKSFSDYVDLYLSVANKSRTEPLPRMTEKVNDRWEVCVSLSDGRFQQVSFVNSIATIKGGTHVDYVTNQVTKYIVRIVNKKKKYSNVKTHDVKNHLWVFVNALIDNPAFDSQTKERLTLPESSFGSKCQLSKDILQKGLLEHFLFSWKTWEQNEALKISDGAKTETVKVEGLMDAEKAGGEESEACTLILVEGRSAQSLAKLGRNVLGRAFYGAFPIQGKFLNVSKAKTSKIANNELVVNIKKILGLKQGRKYYDAKSLRYGRVMLLSDQDPDGSHIKGLLINYFHHFWPLLLKIKPSFIVQFITPIMKVTHPTKEAQLFYSMLRYEDWESEIRQSGNTTEWTRKYCKGLASIDSADAKGYFTNLKFHQKDFVWEGVQDGEAIKLAFSKNKTGARRKLLSDYKPGTHDLQKPTISFKDFVYNDLGEFSRANLERSIPSLVDGLKPSQRKILFCAFEKNLVEDVLVSKFSGYVLDLSVYRHGEQNLDNTIIGMALDYVGRNNVNLLHPSSQFGTRASGKKDAANPRYIFTKLSPATMVLFPKDDDVLLERLFGDGKKIEPTWYIPIIPTVLVNGAEGIASGWKTFIPNYNPRDIVKNINLLHPSRHFPILQMLSSFDLSGRLNP